ncbi:MAG: redox-regulated ATPase YchF [Calditrichaeota bacterium]|nr:MAG: redox-regulated ATPase YchF [Calditrichota bacterium]
MEVGIVGLPVSGKTTLFSTLTGQKVEMGYGGAGKVEVHRGVVKVPDERLDRLTEIFNPRKKVPATIEYIEVGGLDKEQKDAQGFDPQFLQVLKTTDALCVVIRAFEDPILPHPEGSIDIVRDMQTIETEFLLSDLSIVENRLERLEKQIKKAREEHLTRELELMQRCHAHLEQERPLREMEFTEQEALILRGYQFLSAKPLVVVINIDEKDIPRSEEFLTLLPEKTGVKVIALSARVELEISQLPEEERKIFLEDMGITEPALNKLIRTSYELLGLISFFTVGEDECRAWTIRKGTPAVRAAGVIHTDLERGFIRAEVVHYDDFIRLGSLAKCREQGVLRLEGKNYVVQDGDIITVRFNV